MGNLKKEWRNSVQGRKMRILQSRARNNSIFFQDFCRSRKSNGLPSSTACSSMASTAGTPSGPLDRAPATWMVPYDGALHLSTMNQRTTPLAIALSPPASPPRTLISFPTEWTERPRHSFYSLFLHGPDNSPDWRLQRSSGAWHQSYVGSYSKFPTQSVTRQQSRSANEVLAQISRDKPGL